ncbi:alpha/beta hydrolase [Pseudonocardia acidicola]|uniref:Alpha/beta hydrolase n=1 Tax=Pseudonocardia acidicola TaxID=2724939 RepID=A0ABX1S3W8_9PSEU|nr:alpha/beta hydrolase [Pseudonocardia acidicola]NMH96230.1 alpha/beta hydrolase [Pseudonocardia acidicola]
MLAIFALVAALSLACGPAVAATPPVPADGQPPSGAPAPGLARFYDQHLSWGSCAPFATTPADKQAYTAPRLQCAYLEVPENYANPGGATVRIGLLRVPASDPAHRIGSLVMNPGGPGASGMSTAASFAAQVAATDLGRRFDFVGFDPRSVASSQPAVLCETPAEQDAERAADLSADTSPSGVAKLEAQEKTDNAECVARTGTGTGLLANIGTRDVARDLDVMRAALGDQKLTFLGYSYGTRLGTAYAEAFPHNVRAMILDGAIDPAQNPIDRNVDQVAGFQKAFDAFAAFCTRRSDCALGTDPARAVAAYQALTRPLLDHPAPTADGRTLTYDDATIGTITALYQPAGWQTLNTGLAELARGRGDTLMKLADAYDNRSPDGSYGNDTAAFTAISCVDDPPVTDRATARALDARDRAAAPFEDSGRPPSDALGQCAFWPVPPTTQPHVPNVSGLPPVVVISTTGDPATPYRSGVNLAKDLGARLLTVQGTQHTAFLQGITCVDSAGVAYLTSLTLPAKGMVCAAS